MNATRNTYRITSKANGRSFTTGDVSAEDILADLRTAGVVHRGFHGSRGIECRKADAEAIAAAIEHVASDSAIASINLLGAYVVSEAR